MPVTARWSPPDAPQIFAKNLATAPAWMPQAISKAARRLGPRVVDVMRDVTDANRYTGALGESIKDEYSNGDATITIAPNVKRGRYDGGLLLELGTKPIPNAPWGPIAPWASFRGAPMPGAWLKIRMQGVSPHPFLDNTLSNVIGDVDEVLLGLLDDVINRFIFANL